MAKIIVFGNLPESLINFRGPLLKSMVDSGNTVFALSSPCSKELSSKITNLGVTHIPIPLDRTSINPLKDLATLLVLFRTISGIQPDCIISYAVKPVFYGAFVAKILKIDFFSMIVGLGYTGGYVFSSENSIKLKGKLLWPFISFLYKVSLRNIY